MRETAKTTIEGAASLSSIVFNNVRRERATSDTAVVPGGAGVVIMIRIMTVGTIFLPYISVILFCVYSVRCIVIYGSKT